jgi:Meiotically up-regulated gene 113
MRRPKTIAVKVKQHKGKWWVFIDHQGKRKAKCVGTSKRAAEQVAEKIQAKIALGKPSPTMEQILQAQLNQLAEVNPHGISGTCVYFLQAQHGGPVKIGFTQDLVCRMQTLGTGSPSPLRVLAVAAEGTPDMEADLHAAFAAARLHGEWFHLTEDLVDYIAMLSTRHYERSTEQWA